MSNMRVVPVGRMGDLPETVDVAIIGSGIGGSTIAYGLAGSGARIVVVERGSHLGAHPAAETRGRSSSAVSFDRSRLGLTRTAVALIQGTIITSAATRNSMAPC